LQELLEYGARTSAREQVLGYAGAFGEVALVGIVYALVTRGRVVLSEERVAAAGERVLFPLVLAYSVVPLLTFLLLGCAMALPTKGALAGVQQGIFPVVDFLTNRAVMPWHIILSSAAIIAAFLFARRGQAAIALYLGIFGGLEIWGALARPGALLSVLDWRGQGPVEFWWLLIFTGAAICWGARGRLKPERQSQLVVLLFVITLMRQRGFIENPFSAFFGFAGVVLIAFTLVWDMATRGSWANADSPGLPRVSRIFLYLGYVLLAATVLTWAVTTHDLQTVRKLTGDSALVGFDRFGKPLLYAMFALVLTGTARKADARADDATAS